MFAMTISDRCTNPGIFSGARKAVLTCGLFFIILGVLFEFFWIDILEYAIKKEIELSDSSESYSMWVENPMPLHIDFYFFNWTNPSDLSLREDKPRLRESGPYRFREKVKKVGIEWNANGTVTYRKLRTWHFEPMGSEVTLDDNITTLNVVALTAARSTKHWSRLTRMPLSVALSSTQKMHVTKKVREFLFEGFSDPLIDIAYQIPGLSSQIPFDKFGWFYKRNGTSDFDGVFNMETGANGLEVFGKLRFWNYRNRTSFYDDHCGEVFGSAGEFWPPKRPKNEDIAMFSPDMCRFIKFRYEKEESLGKLKGYRYDSGRALFDNGTLDPNKKCFCGGECHPSGTANVSACRSGAPAFVSYPHFHLADSSYLTSISGMSPRPQDHDMYIILEQRWGIPLEVAIRLQINILIEPDSGIRMYRDVRRIFFPMIWFEQKVIMPEDKREEIKGLLELLQIGRVSSVVLGILGSSCIFIWALFRLCIKRKTEHETQLEQKE